MWHPNCQFDLDDLAFLQWMYQIVLRESIHREEAFGEPGRNGSRVFGWLHWRRSRRVVVDIAL